jgi:hypothetical protein
MKNKFYETREDLRNIKDVDTLLKKTGLDWGVETFTPTFPNGEEIPNAQFIVKTIDNEPVYTDYLGFVSDKYKVLSNKEAFEFLNSLIKKITFENAIEINNGKQIYISTDIGDRYVDCIDETVHCKMFLIHSYNGSTAFTISIVPIVNGVPLNLPLTSVKRSRSLNHTVNISERMIILKDTLSFADNYFTAFINESKKLKKISINREQIERFAELAYPMPDKMKVTEQKINNVKERRSDLLNCVIGETEPKNAMDFILGVSEYIATLNPKRKTKTFEQNKFAQIVAGHKILDMAYKYVMG